MPEGNLKRKLGWLEAGLYLGGVALLVVFFQIRSEGQRQAAEGIEAFHSTVESSVTGESLPTSVMVPDKALWDSKRIAEYEASLKVEAGPPLAVMTIDKLNIQVPVYNGADDFNLNRGVARIKGTAAIDAGGNLGIAGHRDGFFRGLKDVEIGDDIDLQTARGMVTYTVSSIVIVDPSDVSVLAQTPEPTVTLVTCYPFYYVGHAPKRFIVKATAKHYLAKN